MDTCRRNPLRGEAGPIGSVAHRVRLPRPSDFPVRGFCLSLRPEKTIQPPDWIPNNISSIVCFHGALQAVTVLWAV